MGRWKGGRLGAVRRGFFFLFKSFFFGRFGAALGVLFWFFWVV